MFQFPFEIECGFSTMERQSISAVMCAITWMPHLRLDGLGAVDQSLGHHDRPIYPASISSYGVI
jgi:hypothetical protein